MSDELRDRVMRGLSTVEWPDARTIRKRASRRRARRVVTGCVAVVAAIAVVWTAGPLVRHEGAAPRPADTTVETTDPTGDGEAAVPRDTRRGYGMMRAEDFGPGFQVNSWGSYRTTEGGQDANEQVLEWPPHWLTACPAYAAEPPAGFRGHRGGLTVRADPSPGSRAAPVLQFVMRFADETGAGAVVQEARQIAARCASLDLAGKQRYTATVAADVFAGDDAVRVDVTGVGLDHATGGQIGAPGLDVYVLVQVGRAVILLTSAGSVDAVWLQGLADLAVGRLCGETDVC